LNHDERIYQPDGFFHDDPIASGQLRDTGIFERLAFVTVQDFPFGSAKSSQTLMQTAKIPVLEV
jgi:hypothetical protein